MTTTWTTRAAVGLAATGLLSLGWVTTVQAAPTPDPAPTATATSDAALATRLTHMREEERLARDLYSALAARHAQAAPFANIARSEQVHFEAVGLLLDRYGVADPSAGRAAGSFADPTLQALYDRLLASGSESLPKAYEAGIAVETLDIADLESAISQTSQADVRNVLANLQRGSANHLSAFTAAKDGRAVGIRNGQGMQNGRDAGNLAGQGRNRWGGEIGGGADGRPGGRPQSTARPASCPLR